MLHVFLFRECVRFLFQQLTDHELDSTGYNKFDISVLMFADELNMALVFSTKAHADIVQIDASDALSMPGVVDFICHKDVPGSNSFATIVRDEEIFASKTVCH